jgi:uncharacterized protein YlxW (UPF0749 family)
VVLVGEDRDERERLARLEEKVDQILKKIDEKTFNEKAMEERIRALEITSGNIKVIGGAAWAVLLVLIGKVFGKWFGG